MWGVFWCAASLSLIHGCAKSFHTSFDDLTLSESLRTFFLLYLILTAMLTARCFAATQGGWRSQGAAQRPALPTPQLDRPTSNGLDLSGSARVGAATGGILNPPATKRGTKRNHSERDLSDRGSELDALWSSRESFDDDDEGTRKWANVQPPSGTNSVLGSGNDVSAVRMRPRRRRTK